MPCTKLCFDLILAELHGDLFSRHANPLEGYGFVAVDEIGEILCVKLRWLQYRYQSVGLPMMHVLVVTQLVWLRRDWI